jgi:hypothetical protein
MIDRNELQHADFPLYPFSEQTDQFTQLREVSVSLMEDQVVAKNLISFGFEINRDKTSYSR